MRTDALIDHAAKLGLALGRAGAEAPLLALLLVVLAMLVIPLPTPLIDLLIALNLTLAVLIFLSAFRLDRVISFSSFPAVLLISTLFRLALTVSSSRLILLQADAGAIIASFGRFVVGDNLLVGCVVFAIVTIVQFIVITRGAERVAEVAARFALDGMPGKQMSIDADLRAGLLPADQAAARRELLERESQLYGAFDGAMKFVKGDAIAGIVVIIVNLLGGVSVGMVQHRMDLGSALSTYALLSIGDALVGQIPALLIAISAGLVVTRIGSAHSWIGRDIGTQLLGQPATLMASGALLLLLGLLPGFPLAVCALLAAALWGLAALRPALPARVAAVPAAAPDAAAVVLCAPEPQRAALQACDWPAQLRQAYAATCGIALPAVALQAPASDAETGDYTLLLHGAELARWPLERAPAELLQPAVDALACQVGALFGIQQTRELIDRVEARQPELAHELMRQLTLQRVAEVLQRLLQERVPLHHPELVFDALVLRAGRDKDADALLESARAALARQITQRYLNRGLLCALTLDPITEQALRDDAWDPAQLQALRERASAAQRQPQPWVLLSPAEVRAQAWRMLAPMVPGLAVLSYAETGALDSVRVLGSL